MNLTNIPVTPGIYQFLNNEGEILYVGKAINLKNRVKSYFQKNLLSPKTQQLVKQIKTIKTVKTESEFDALLLEAKLINSLQPKYNITWRDDKHPLYIKITPEEFPKIQTVRREDDKKSVYFGPFPSATTVRQTLKFLREIFPYCSEKRIGKRPCFYSHIGLCDPCPNDIASRIGSDYQEGLKRYRNNIFMIRKVLEGKAPSVVRQLQKYMKQYSNNSEFEQAAQVKHQLDKIEYLRQMRTPVREYMKNPNLYDDMRQEELSELASVLGQTSLSHIEGFDISNIQGTHATGSMVTFIDGEPEKSYYRRFKIRLKNTPDDTFMMHEMLLRRLAHEDWPYPDLIMVDGGKGQINAARHAMHLTNISIPLIGLAKRLEEILVPQQNDTFKTIRLPESSKALHLVQRIRNEAHRFANTYHRKLRAQGMV
ncbi:MAG: excinuclease ABC subunit C, excinuclease ABC subunit C [Microgenomates group bacterium GW2011_GWC1_41_8]|uniref:Excinuclease ABC C subunit domain protein n=3 Tax=Candidatus Roizmaniibacteriota TaxID=1752723 RepID=A0A0G1ABS6_9BACT|nr:MAG: Excinuclease ABC C subunit domain protein [Candidatus Levybacteria bacterium GW2011_GWA2_40_16]KKR71847.1 MAG: Excinuclease ABC C subunit domain protein [Candidatus Roizmanbacteria bacterium GW2011_GWB1_40_7]KKR92655.1 MAG: Excinuclease ABC C subunit domain protein [Candidatus Roizmanbacteria bacterium GW2011_GWA1_41_13]KKS22693.1 MAG: Excinuclease ABC C subunit domain protein [Candidatus Roizmanbacteria bacterium GW2011_GWC2_41_7]KKS24616.1 MAG: excinuclease ABC subunit C, excinuclease